MEWSSTNEAPNWDDLWSKTQESKASLYFVSSTASRNFASFHLFTAAKLSPFVLHYAKEHKVNWEEKMLNCHCDFKRTWLTCAAAESSTEFRRSCSSHGKWNKVDIGLQPKEPGKEAVDFCVSLDLWSWWNSLYFRHTEIVEMTSYTAFLISAFA